MRRRALAIVGLGVALAMTLAGNAGALKLGITAPPNAFALLA